MSAGACAWVVVGGDELAGLRAHRAFCVDEDSVDVSSALVGKETSSQLVLDGHRDALLRDKVIRANFAVPVVIPVTETRKVASSISQM